MSAPLGNKYYLNVHNPGRPHKLQDLQEIKSRVDEFIKENKEHTEKIVIQKTAEVIEVPKALPLTVEGLCVALRVDGTSLKKYLLSQHENEVDKDIVRFLKDTLEVIKLDKVRGLMTGEWSAAGAIFVLKNNFGWTDKHEISQEVTHTVKEIKYITPEAQFALDVCFECHHVKDECQCEEKSEKKKVLKK